MSELSPCQIIMLTHIWHDPFCACVGQCGQRADCLLCSWLLSCSALENDSNYFFSWTYNEVSVALDLKCHSCHGHFIRRGDSSLARWRCIDVVSVDSVWASDYKLTGRLKWKMLLLCILGNVASCLYPYQEVKVRISLLWELRFGVIFENLPSLKMYKAWLNQLRSPFKLFTTINGDIWKMWISDTGESNCLNVML